MNTARIAEPISGDKLYQRRARAALPLLVRQAQAGTPIFYSALAEELGMPNSRNLNYVLGSIGQSLVKLSRAWRAKVPPIQCLVINKATGLPGNGVGWFLDARGKGAFSRLPLRRRREIVDVQLQMVYGFPRWAEVLEVLSLKPVTTGFTAMVKRVRRTRC
jgi:hypothetical protein